MPLWGLYFRQWDGHTNIRKEIIEGAKFMPVLKDTNGFVVRDIPELAKSLLAISGFELVKRPHLRYKGQRGCQASGLTSMSLPSACARHPIPQTQRHRPPPLRAQTSLCLQISQGGNGLRGYS